MAMLRRFVGCLMLFAFILQGVAQAGAAAFADSQAMQDCECCPQGMSSALDCAEQCSLVAGIPTTAPPLVWDAPTQHRSFAAGASPVPTYLPLKPPPKSWL